MTERTCSLDGCERPHTSGGYCRMHYQRWRRTGSAGEAEARADRVRVRRTCSVEGCDQPHQARGMCSTHYNRWQSAEAHDRPRCAVDDCERPRLRREWCTLHYDRWRKHGDPETVATRTRGVCSFPDCGRPHFARGMCATHDRQQQEGKTLTPIRAWRSHLERDEDGRKLCRVCLTWLAEDRFGSHSRNPDGLAAMCKECNRDKHRLRNYGLTVEDYTAMLEAQGGGCAICGQPCATGRLLAVDHDHACCPEPARSCGRCVRGLLCADCNWAIGLLGDDTDRVAAALRYLTGGSACRGG